MSESSNQGPFERLCFVGMGGHACSKLLPAALANGQEVVGLVSSQDPSCFPGLRVFSRLEDALAGLPTDTLMVIATPPAIHAGQVSACAAAGFDVIVEKPAFANPAEASAVRAVCDRVGTLVVEGFMQRHTTLYSRMVASWVQLRSRVQRISIRFLIPRMPEGTFRTGDGLTSSTLYDIGCYPVSLLMDMGLNISALSIAAVKYPGNLKNEAIRLEGILDGLSVKVEVGVSETYANTVSLHLLGDEELRFEPFFYGRGGDRRIVTVSNGGGCEEVFPDANAFERMLGVPRRAWRYDQTQRWDAMISASTNLDRLAIEFAAHRRRAGS